MPDHGPQLFSHRSADRGGNRLRRSIGRTASQQAGSKDFGAESAGIGIEPFASAPDRSWLQPLEPRVECHAIPSRCRDAPAERA